MTIRWLAAALILSSCGDDDRAPTDGGRDSSADANVMDTSSVDVPTVDAPTVDAGSDAPIDAGVDAPALVCSPPGPGGDCVLRVPVGSFGPLNADCMPRCSAATAATYRACENQACRNAAVDADTTSGISYFIGSAPVGSPPLDCASCVSYQEFHCFSLVCTSEVDDYVDNCIAGVNPGLCDASIFAIDACLAALTPSETATVDACMSSADGPPGCFACE